MIQWLGEEPEVTTLGEPSAAGAVVGTVFTVVLIAGAVVLGMWAYNKKVA